jgi:2'-5' RNA ligase
MPRLFTGLELPANVGRSLAMLRGGLPGARWIEPENYHITLRFIGDVDDRVAEDVALLLGEVNRRGFELRLDRIAAFGGRKPRAVIACVPPVPALLDLQAEHERIMRRIGLDPEARKYTPHVTLARLRQSSSRQVADYLAQCGPFRSLPFQISRFVLYSARASVGGGPYVVEAGYPLAPTAGISEPDSMRGVCLQRDGLPTTLVMSIAMPRDAGDDACRYPRAPGKKRN